MDKILAFRGPYRFLSNFYACPIVIDGETWPTTEHYYQAMKFKGIDENIYNAIRNAKSPGETKSLAKTHRNLQHPKWESMSLQIMMKALRAKFAIPNMRILLINTGDAEIIEGNTWHDNFWGICNCCHCFPDPYVPKHNLLGKMLMKIREELRSSN